MIPNSGIYRLRNTITNDVYIGQTSNFVRRKTDHLSPAKRAKNRNNHLNAAFNKYGADVFVFEILEYVESDKTKLKEREQYWVNVYTQLGIKLYNKRTIVESNLGCSYPFTEQHKKNISESKKGKKQTPEAIANRVKAIKKPIIQIDSVTEQIIKIWDSALDASLNLSVNRDSINHVLRGRQTHAGGYKWKYK